MTDLNPRIIGRAYKPLAARVVRELTPEDLVLLQTERATKTIPLKKLRDSHHWLARLLAQGMRNTEASKITGYTTSRISNLQADAKFSELVAHYRKTTEEIYADAHERMFTLSLEALAVIRERLHDSPEQLSSMGLLEIAKSLLDRTGYGPTSKSTLTTINIDLAGRLDRARARVAANGDGLLEVEGSR